MSHSRRSFLKWTLATGGSLAALPLLEACSSRSSQPAAPPAAANTAPPAATSAAAPAAAAAPTAGPTAATRTGITSAEWNPDTIRAQAGTLNVDTRTEVAKVTPLDYKGQASYWYVGPNQASPQIEVDNDAKLWEAWKQTYPNIPMNMGENVQNLDYNQMLDKLRTAAAGNSAPDVGRLPILWGSEFAAKGQLAEVQLEEFGFKQEDFWSGALKSVTWNGKIYGVPTNNETMAFIWNKDIFKKAGLDPENPPATWDDVVKYSAQIKKATGKAGYGMVARVNAGNTPFRVMPVLWAYGSGALDEADPDPTLPEDLDQQRRRHRGPPGALRHVRARQVGAHLGADQHPDGKRRPVHQRSDRDGDRPSERVRRDDRQGQQGDGRRQGSGRPGGRQHGLRPHAVRPGAPRRRLWRLEHPHLHRPGGWPHGRPQGSRRVHRLHLRAGVVGQELRQLDRLESRQPPGLQDRRHEAAPRSDQVPGSDDVDAALRRAVPGHSRSERHHEQHRAQHDPECVDRHDDASKPRPTMRRTRSKR